MCWTAFFVLSTITKKRLTFNYDSNFGAEKFSNQTN